ncbi:MFS transporter [Streptomyces albidoflavus]|uniref:MFS transporter n=1 Tax=Streptomyces albidoflavus TaxID=1886 RepID=UPI0034092868
MVSPPSVPSVRKPDPSRTGLGGRDFRLLMAATLGTFANYAPMLSVVPLWASGGGAAHSGVGATTGVTMATTVAVQLCMGWLLRRFTLRQIFMAGAVLLGLPTFGYALSSSLGWVLGVSAVRGLGFGMVAVAGSALVADLVPPAQRGRAVGLYGIGVGVPQVLLLPLGVWCAEHVGYTPVFVVAGVLSVLAVPLVWLMSGQRADERESGAPAATTPGQAPRLRPLATPWTLLITAACALGGATSFLPLALAEPAAAPAALFTLTGATMVGRWLAGVRSDRAGTGSLLVASVATCALGMGGFALAAETATGTTVLAVAAGLVYGLGFGALQNDTLVVMFRRAGPRGHGVASTAWNMAYDAGAGLGSLGVGVLAQASGMRGAFAASALLIACVLPLAWRESRHP